MVLPFWPSESNLYAEHRWEAIKAWAHNLFKTLYRRYRWGFMLAGFTALAIAAISWNLETTETYWIWHRYHITPLSLDLSQSLSKFWLVEYFAAFGT